MKANGNVFVLTLGDLESEKVLATGEPIECLECRSILVNVTDPCHSGDSTSAIQDGKWTW